MSTNTHIWWTLERHKPVHEVRRLIIQVVNGPGETTLSQLIGAEHSVIKNGTEYDMRQQADALAQTWQNEGFKLVSETGPPPYDSLRAAIKIAAIMEYTSVLTPNRLNPAAATPLAQWHGVVPRNNGSYEYGFDGSYIHAQGALPPNHGLTVPKDTKELAAFFAKVEALREAVGPRGKFLLL
jgi:hypothetical protein